MRARDMRPAVRDTVSEDNRMEDNRQYVTKKELYTVAVNVCSLVFFAGALSDMEGVWKLYIALWALALMAYYVFKLRATRSDRRPSDLNG